MVALGELCLLGGIECELLGLLVGDVTALDRGADHISGRIDADLNDNASFLVEGICRLRQCTSNTTSGEAPGVTSR